MTKKFLYNFLFDSVKVFHEYIKILILLKINHSIDSKGINIIRRWITYFNEISMK